MSTSYAQTKRVENLHLTRERDRRRGRELATFLLAGLPVACALLAYAALHIETVRVGYMREARQQTVAELTRGEPPAARRARPGVLARPRGGPGAGKRACVRRNPGQVQYVEATRGAATR